MVSPVFLANSEVQQWLNGVEPAWTKLEFDSFNSLHLEPSADNRAIRLEPKLAAPEISKSAVARNALILLRHALDNDGLRLTATGNLSRAAVAEMRGVIEWPDYDRHELFRFRKAINEPDFLPLHFVRVLAQATQLFRTRRGKLIPTRLGRATLAEDRHGALQALLFHIAFWHLNLAYFDWHKIGSWPQTDVGVVLWSLSATANDWLDRETLTRLCTVPVNGIVK